MVDFEKLACTFKPHHNNPFPIKESYDEFLETIELIGEITKNNTNTDINGKEKTNEV